MKSLKILAFLIILLFLTILFDKNIKKSNSIKQNNSSNLVEKQKITPTVSPTNTPTPLPENIQEQTTTSTINNASNINSFIYPNAIVIAKSGNNLILQSNDDADKITDWYKQKIKELGMVASSFIKTNANGKVLNKLAGSSGEKEILVEVAKQHNENTVNISVSARGL